MKDYTTHTLGQLLAHESETIRRLAMSILKLLQRNAIEKQNYCKDCKKAIATGQVCQNYCKNCIPKHNS